jgi:hypothetical protein
MDVMHVLAFMHFESISKSIFQRYRNAVKGTESRFENYPQRARRGLPPLSRGLVAVHLSLFYFFLPFQMPNSPSLRNAWSSSGMRIPALTHSFSDLSRYIPVEGLVAGLPLICIRAEHQGIRLRAGPTFMIA